MKAKEIFDELEDRGLFKDVDEDVQEEIMEFLERILSSIGEWKPIDTCPVGKQFLAGTIIPKHRLMICVKTKDGLILGEDAMPTVWPMTHWVELPKKPE